MSPIDEQTVQATSARAWFRMNLMSGSVQGTSLRASDYQNPLQDSAGHDRTVRLIRADTPRGYVLVPEG
jgi:hypothetical protein